MSRDAPKDNDKRVSTVAFSLDGVDYEVDLDSAGQKALEGALDVYIKASRIRDHGGLH